MLYVPSLLASVRNIILGIQLCRHAQHLLHLTLTCCRPYHPLILFQSEQADPEGGSPQTHAQLLICLVSSYHRSWDSTRNTKHLCRYMAEVQRREQLVPHEKILDQWRQQMPDPCISPHTEAHRCFMQPSNTKKVKQPNPFNAANLQWLTFLP